MKTCCMYRIWFCKCNRFISAMHSDRVKCTYSCFSHKSQVTFKWSSKGSTDMWRFITSTVISLNQRKQEVVRWNINSKHNKYCECLMVLLNDCKIPLCFCLFGLLTLLSARLYLYGCHAEARWIPRKSTK